MTRCERNLQTFNSKIAANEGLGHVNSLDIYLHTILLAVRLLRSTELASGAKHRRGMGLDQLNRLLAQ